MTAVATIEKVLATELLVPELTIIPDRGTDAAEIKGEESRLGRSLSIQHRRLLERWNGIGLEIIRFLGCGEATGEIGRIADFQVDVDFGFDDAIIFGADASGFAYIEAKNGRVLSFDTDGGMIKEIAKDIDDFVDRVVFGKDAAQFAGDDWLAEVKGNGLI